MWRNLLQTTIRPLRTSSNVFKVKPLILSDIGEGTRDVEIMKFNVVVGQTVEAWQEIVEVQSDKATVSIVTPKDGKIHKIHWNEGDTVRVGQHLIDIDYFNDDSDDEEEEKVPDVPEPKKKILATNTVKKLAEKHGIDLTDFKGTGTNGRITKNDVLNVANPSSATDSSSQKEILATPQVRKLAKDLEVDLAQITGTGPGGRITADDVKNFTAAPEPAGTPTIAPPAPVQALEEDVTIKLSAIQKAMTQSMKIANQVPCFGYCDEVNMGNLMRTRAALKDAILKEHGLNISYMPFIVKAVSMALKEYPMLNASVAADEQSMTYHASHNIGIAVDTPHGLLVPNIKNCEQRSVLDIMKEIKRLTDAGRVNKLSMQDIQGGTFTLSNIGAIGGTYAAPVVLPPQVAIGALGRTQKLPRFDENDNVIAQHLMAVSWYADHRVIEGAQMARFSNKMKFYLENPDAMMLNLR